jgi:molybdopterin-guanine dinucleotide biosynthesis protein A
VKTLGVVLAGGRASRFGSDKAEAMLAGRSLLDHALDALSPYCEIVAVAGREDGRVLSLADRPGPGFGPLGGLAAALHHAALHGFARVLSVPVDCAILPPDLLTLLDPAPSCLNDQPVIGLWPSAAAREIEDLLSGGGSRAVRRFADAIGARAVRSAVAPSNVNTTKDLAALSRRLDREGG